MIIHRSEQPACEQIYVIPMDNTIEVKILAIDSGDYSTMVFDEEY